MLIYQIYYDKIQKWTMSNAAIPYYNDKADKYLETSVILDIAGKVKEKDFDYISIISHKFRQKTGLRVTDAIARFESNPGYGCYSFFDKHKKTNVWKKGDTWHPLFSKIGNMIASEMGLEPFTSLDTEVIYYNFWFLEKSVFLNYIRFLEEVLLTFEHPKIKALLYEDAKYTGSNTGWKASEQRCMELFDRPYYTYHPFICERLLSTYLAINNINVKNLI